MSFLSWSSLFLWILILQFKFFSLSLIAQTPEMINANKSRTPLVQNELENLTPLERLDKIASQAGSLEELLNNQEILTDYKKALDHYYGTDLSQSAFDEKVRQIKIMIKEIPGFSNRLWTQGENNSKWKTFRFQAEFTSSGREVHKERWKDFLIIKKENLKEKAKEIINLSDKEKEKDQVEVILQKLNLSFQKMETDSRALRQSQGREAANTFRREYFKRIKEDVHIQSAFSYIILKLLESEEVDDILRSGDADLIFDYIEQFENLGVNSQSPFSKIAEVPQDLLSLLGNQMPKVSELKDLDPERKRKGFPLFPQKLETSPTRGTLTPMPRTSQSTIELKSSPRRLHFIWEGIKFCECVEHEPERWAVSILESVESYFLEENGLHRGSLKLVSGKIIRRKKGINYFLKRKVTEVTGIELNGGFFNRKMRIRDSEVNLITSSYLSEIIIKEVAARDPKKRRGALVFNIGTDEPQNTGAIKTAKELDLFLFTEEDDLVGRFKHNDSLSDRIIKAANKILKSNGGMTAGILRMMHVSLNKNLGNMVTNVSINKYGFHGENYFRVLSPHANIRLHNFIEFFLKSHYEVQVKIIEACLKRGLYLEEIKDLIPELSKEEGFYKILIRIVKSSIEGGIYLKETPDLILKLLESENHFIRSEVPGLLRSQTYWDKKTWDIVLSLLKDEKGNVRDDMMIALADQSEWTMEVWKQISTNLNEFNLYSQDSSKKSVPFLLMPEGTEVLLIFNILRALKKQKVWPPEIWQSIYDLLVVNGDNRIQKAALEALKTQSRWPPKVWILLYRMVKLDDLPNSVRSAVFYAINEKSDWIKFRAEGFDEYEGSYLFDDLDLLERFIKDLKTRSCSDIVEFFI